MNDLLECWDSFEGRLDAARKYCILTDFDGTLVPLASAPDLAGLSGNTLRVLEALSGHPNVTVGIVSGRTLPDLILRIGLDNIWYVGNHGFDVRSPWGDEHRYYSPEDARYLASVGDQLAVAMGGIEGVLLEHKGPIVAVHYRRVAPERVAEVQLAFYTVLRSHTPRLMMNPGKMVLEMRLRSNCNKGIAVRQIRRELPAGCLVIYFGDDLTDRDVFRELRRVGVSVEVGAADSPQADYSLRDPTAVLEVLQRLNEKLRRRSDASGVHER
jgi:alpha,alpha-trehalase